MNTAIRPITHFALVLSVVALLAPGTASAEMTGKEVVGTWTLVSAAITKHGKHKDLFGASPLGQVVFDAHGKYTLVMMRSDIPRFAHNNRKKGSATENAAVIHGSIAHFGSYSYNAGDKTYTLHIKASTYPNWDNATQTRRLTVHGDEMLWDNPAGSTGGSLNIILRRLK